MAGSWTERGWPVSWLVLVERTGESGKQVVEYSMEWVGFATSVFAWSFVGILVALVLFLWTPGATKGHG